VFVCTHILTVRTQVFLFKANYGTAVAGAPFFMSLKTSIKITILKNAIHFWRIAHKGNAADNMDMQKITFSLWYLSQKPVC
ncbi:hypothetical protein KTI07_16930, partial [Acinetobacter lwoffii]|jgi:hypothetical protein